MTAKKPTTRRTKNLKAPAPAKLVFLVNAHRRNGAIGARATVPENETGPWLEKGWKLADETTSRTG